MRVLALNPGSSSMKASMVADGVTTGSASWAKTDSSMISDVLARWPEPDAVSVRFVHGGPRTTPALVDDALLDELAQLTPMAPVHQPLSLGIARSVRRLLPGVPLVACFDTAFHAGLPDAAARYPLPRAWTWRNCLRRSGFHGLSCQYAVRRTAEMLAIAELRLVCCHIGAGVSVTAVKAGVSVDTSMGFTPLEGAMMATRSGSVDPGLLLHLMKTAPMTADQMIDALYHRSGLAGMTGTDGDMRTVLAARGHPDADLGLAVYLHRLRREIGAAAMSLDRLDAVVFTGGVAQYQPEVAGMLLGGLSVLGLRENGTPRGTGDRVISAEGARPAALIVVPREDLELARGAEEALVHAKT